MVTFAERDPMATHDRFVNTLERFYRVLPWHLPAANLCELHVRMRAQLPQDAPRAGAWALLAALGDICIGTLRHLMPASSQ
jgi:hypothetical protein